MLKILSVFILLYFLACLLLYVKQRSILYFPTAEALLSNTEQLWLETSQVTLKIWVINNDQPVHGKPAIIYFGGNSEAVEDNIADYKNMFSDYRVYIVNYRGYGGSSGTPTEKGFFDDALFIYDQLKKQHSSISVIGRSLGSGVASYLAANREVSKLVLITPYDSISNVAQSHYPLFPAKWLMKDKFESIKYAPSINSKVLILYVENDQVVPMIHTKNLLKALPGAQSQLIQDAAHNDISSKFQYQKTLSEFMTAIK